MKNKKAKTKISIFISAAAVICAAVIILVSACFNTGESIVFHGSKSNVLKQSKARRNTFVIGVSSAIPDMHPYFHDNDALYFFQKLVYEPLVSVNNDGSVSYINADKIVFENAGTQAKVYLDKKKTFSDGTGLTADIVLDSYNAFMEKETAYNDLLNNVEYIQKTDDYTLVFKFKLVRISNMQIFNIPVIYDADRIGGSICLGTGNYAVKSITPDGDSVLVRNENAVKKGKYSEIVLRPMDYSQIQSLADAQNFDVFMLNKESQADIIKESRAYDIYAVGQENGWYLNYNSDNLSVCNAIANLASGEEFFKETHDFGAYSKGITSAFMKKPNYHSRLKKGNFDDVKSITFLHNYEAQANAIYQTLSNALLQKDVACSDFVSDFSDYPSVLNADVLIYYGKFTDMVHHADHERFFEKYRGMDISDFNKNIEKYFALQNKITPVSKDTVWYASLTGKNTMDLFY